MINMRYREKAEYFSSIADKWDSFIHNREELFTLFRDHIRLFNIHPDSVIVDVGCGTGNLTIALLEHLSENGRIFAVDVSPDMIEMAKKKIWDQRVKWLVSSIEEVLIEDDSCDLVICYSVWPHIEDPEKAILNIRRILRSGGRLIIWHTQGRDRVNEIHRNIDKVVNNDILIPATELMELVKSYNFESVICEESEKHYLVIAKKYEL